MTTRTQTIAEMLRSRRGDDFKSEAARTIGVSRNIYPTWESGHAIPGEEWIPDLSRYLDIDEESLVIQRYHEKLDRMIDIRPRSSTPRAELTQELVAA